MEKRPVDKPFKSISEQIELLESRGVICDESTKSALIKEGYYSVVNGYKDPFINEQATLAIGEDRFINETRFDDLYKLFLFDRKLRNLSLEILLEVEAQVRTICTYTFSEFHDGYSGYTKRTSFIREADYGRPDYEKNLTQMINILESKSKNGFRAPLAHYRKKYGRVPLWVLATDLTFGNIEHFFKLMKLDEQRLVCKRIAYVNDLLGDRELGYFSPAMCATSLATLVKVRNCCAHDERLYCTRFGKNGDNYADFVRRLRRFVTPQRYEEFVKEIQSLVFAFSEESAVLSHIVSQMGI